jgi:hypothetical protein
MSTITVRTTAARTKDDVDNMTARDRLWDSLNYSYGKKRENSDEQFRQAYSQADRQMLSRGMQRSSYGAQTLANIDKQRVDAQNDIYDNQIADYENRLYQLERDEKADDQWERQFAEGQRQYNENLGFQRERAEAQDNQWQQSFNYQKGRDAEADRQWQKAFDAQQAQQAEQNRQWQQTFSYQQSRDTVSDQQWQKAFDQSNTNTDRQLAASYIQAIIANGQDPTDELLARAGLSRADANAMKAQIAAGGGWSGGSSGGGGSSNKSTTLTPPPASDGGLDGLLNNNNKSGGNNKPVAGVATRVVAQNKDAKKATVTSVQNEILTGAKVRARKKTK